MRSPPPLQLTVREMAAEGRRTNALTDWPNTGCNLSRQLCVTMTVLLGLAASGRSGVSDHIGEQARSTGTVDMTKAADFAWEQVRIYTPYSLRKTVCKDLGGLAPDCQEKAPAQVAEDEYLLVFIDAGKATRYVRHARRNGNFLSSTGVLTLRHDAAILDTRPSQSPHQGQAIYLQVREQARP